VRDSLDVFHLAIPVRDLQATEHFYVSMLGCKLARRYDDRVTFDFFGDQLVCHLSQMGPENTEALDLYPRHFGVTFRDERDFDAVHELCLRRGVPFFSGESTRFADLVESHRTFVVRDPSDNLIEFKHYRDHRMMY
jgi:extradiol dioxygenase family protein